MQLLTKVKQIHEDSRASMEPQRLESEKNHGLCFDDSVLKFRYHGAAWGTSIEEKQGRHRQSKRQMHLFRDVLDNCRFMDLGFIGLQFTWTK